MKYFTAATFMACVLVLHLAGPAFSQSPQEHVRNFFTHSYEGTEYGAAVHFLETASPSADISTMLIEECARTNAGNYSFLLLLQRHGGADAVSYLKCVLEEGLALHSADPQKFRTMTDSWADLPMTAYVLYSLGEREYIEVVYDFLNEPNKVDRGAASSVLGNVDTPRSRRALKDVIENDPMELPIVFAIESLVALDGERATTAYLQNIINEGKMSEDFVEHYFLELKQE